MKVFSAPAQAAIEDGTAIVGGAVEIACDPPVRVWNGYGPLTLDGHEFTGVGDRGLVRTTNAKIGGAAQAIGLSLSGVDPDVLPLLEADELKGAPTSLRRLIFDGSGRQLLDSHVFSRGRVDTISTDETIGGEAAITAAIEGAARGLGRRGGRMRSDADQRLVDPTDGGMRHVSYAGSKQLYWGGQRPAPAAASAP